MRPMPGPGSVHRPVPRPHPVGPGAGSHRPGLGPPPRPGYHRPHWGHGRPVPVYPGYHRPYWQDRRDNVGAAIVGGLVAGAAVGAVAGAIAQQGYIEGYPVGTRLSAVPDGCGERWYGPTLYYQCPDGLWLQRVVDGNYLFFVVTAPP